MSRTQLGDDVGAGVSAGYIARESALRARRRVLREILACGLVATGVFGASAHAATHAVSASLYGCEKCRVGNRPRTAIRDCSPPGKPGHAAHAVNLPAASDLHRDATSSVRERVPILLFFDRGDCPYCERALREYLVPMSRDEKWRERAIYRQIEVDRELPLTDFDGTPTTHRAFAARYRAALTPTVMIVDGRGEKIGDALIGLMTPDFYAAYLENAVTAGVKQLRG